MIVDVDIKQIGIYISELSNLVDEYEEAQLNIFNQLKDSCNNWRDGNSLDFNDQIKDEKNSSNLFLGEIQNNQRVLSYIYNEYKTIGSKLHFNMSKKESIVNAIENAISKANTAMNAINSIDSSYSFSALSSIRAQYEVIKSARRELQSMKDKIIALYNKVKAIEDNISSKVAALDDINITNFNYSFQ